VLHDLMNRYKSIRKQHHVFYERQLWYDRIKAINLLQVGIDTTIEVWLKYLKYANIYCIDSFEHKQPTDFKFLKEDKVHWARCDVHDKKHVEKIMNGLWKKPRFDVIIDNTNNYENLRRYCIGKFYYEEKDKVRIVQ
tara:strand:+ start:98 stop:508 length:411 start_codon:yes stop_codon:yes gene_type:complete